MIVKGRTPRASCDRKGVIISTGDDGTKGNREPKISNFATHIKGATGMKRLFWFNAACAVALAVCIGAGGVWAAPWSFGVMSDTQWIGPNTDGKNPHSVPVGIINQINPQLIKAGVKFVVQVGDLTDNGSSPAMAERAHASQALYNAGIGFYPLRGNHESSADAATQFQGLYPQTQGNGSNV